MKKESIYKEATGKVPIRMTNDYLFKVLLQKNEIVLTELISSLLFTESSKVRNVKITNPIIPGETINDKTVVLDVNVNFNDGERINLEIQVINHINWEDRSTYYACRNYAKLGKGHDYSEIKPVYQIGLVDFTPVPGHPKFYSRYRLSEIEDHYVYTEKLTIGTVDLTNIALATENDKAYNIDKWASLFKAETWEDIKMLAEKYEAIDEAATTIYQLSGDERIRQQCEDREKNEMERLYIENRLKRQIETIDQQAETIDQQAETIDQLTDENNQLTEENKQKDETIDWMAKRIAELEANQK